MANWGVDCLQLSVEVKGFEFVFYKGIVATGPLSTSVGLELVIVANSASADNNDRATDAGEVDFTIKV